MVNGSESAIKIVLGVKMVNEEQIRINERNIKHAKENLVAEEKMLKLKLKKLRPLNPEFEYELDEEFIKLNAEMMKLEFERKKEEIVYAIKKTKEENEQLKKKYKIPYAL